MKAKRIIMKCHKVDSGYYDRDDAGKRTEVEIRGISEGIDKDGRTQIIIPAIGATLNEIYTNEIELDDCSKECTISDLETNYLQAILELKDMKLRFDCNDFSKALKEFDSNRITHADTVIFIKQWRERWESYKNDPLKKLL